jgi:OOP family OmpA-OmpF porin
MRRLTIAVALGLASWGWSEHVDAQASGDVASTNAQQSSVNPEPQSAAPVGAVEGDLEGQAHASDSFMRRYRPTMLAFEAGIFGGAYFVSDKHNLQDLDRTFPNGHEKLGTAGELGLRAAFYPLSFFGAELEGALLLNDTERTGDATKTWIVRGHGILQLPLGRLVPFVLGGGGLTSLRAKDSLGNDKDPVVYFGGGLKFAFNRHLSIRLDVRDNLAQKNKLLAGVEDGDSVHNLEVLGGLSLTLGRTPWSDAPPDSDGDGLYDGQDRCPTVAGPKPDGCPPPPDGDGDGVPDPSDPCPSEPEDGNPPDARDGCPNKDVDGDSIPVPADLCPAEPGVAPDGCPVKDSDGDGFLDPADKCPQQAETKNNYEDTDGCPDDLPPEVAKFTGVIKGILFQTGKAVIRPASFPLLNDAVVVLKQYPALRLRVSGHTDSTGKPERNMQLSQERADAVKTYLTSKGIEASRVETRGAGPDEPLADNKTPAGKAKNRRIEFELLPQ